MNDMYLKFGISEAVLAYADKTEQTPHTIIRVVLRLHNDYADHRRYHAAYKCINQVFLHKVIKIE